MHDANDTILGPYSLPALIKMFVEAEQVLAQKGRRETIQERALYASLRRCLFDLCQQLSLCGVSITEVKNLQNVVWEHCREAAACWMEDQFRVISELVVHIEELSSGQMDVRSSEERFSPPLSAVDAQQQAFLLRALADPHRLRILSLLCRYEGIISVFEIVAVFHLAQPTISHHLRILRDAGVVHCVRKGLWAYYYVEREQLAFIRERLQALDSASD